MKILHQQILTKPNLKEQTYEENDFGLRGIALGFITYR